MKEDFGENAFPNVELMSVEADKEAVSEEDIDNVLKILENFSETETSRMKLQVSEKTSKGDVERQYHHGRCDVGSPWARGESFDVLE
ncbi:MAG: hypothetical protein K2K54_00460 [Lachnospiraceae bacterium]|nr:hypothetical protein [Lachnospiraceae bacterium]